MDHNEEVLKAFLDDLMTSGKPGQIYALGVTNMAVTLRVENIERNSGPLKIYGQEMIQRVMDAFSRQSSSEIMHNLSDSFSRNTTSKPRSRRRSSRDADFKRFMSSIGMEDTNG